MKTKRLIVCLALFWMAGGSQAALVEDAAHPGLIRDTDQGITWLKDTNYAWRPGLQPSQGWTESMTWYDATTWASQLSINSGGQTYNNWRLPTLAEMVYLHDNYHVSVYRPGPFVVDLFLSRGSADAWAHGEGSATEALVLDMGDPIYWRPEGYPTLKTLSNDNMTWGAVMVPEPETYAMLMAGLGMLGLMARRRKTG